MSPVEIVTRVQRDHRMVGARECSCGHRYLACPCGHEHGDRPATIATHQRHVAVEAVAALGLREERVRYGRHVGGRRYVTDWQEVGQ